MREEGGRDRSVYSIDRKGTICRSDIHQRNGVPAASSNELICRVIFNTRAKASIQFHSWSCCSPSSFLLRGFVSMFSSIRRLSQIIKKHICVSLVYLCQSAADDFFVTSEAELRASRTVTVQLATDKSSDNKSSSIQSPGETLCEIARYHRVNWKIQRATIGLWPFNETLIVRKAIIR